MNRDEMKTAAVNAAKDAGETVRRNFVDDWVENVAWVFAGVLIGIVIGKFVL